ncbi:hypothetical protein AMATHDRAFT_46374 [Amanita thiersii Skay4041]|uniref:Peptidase A1 domain-containing protein n=1 Tax=Amanita thiersii Skay4041 TaxID=703135 RepID=A0A2A9NWM8_9AGAR|nr:hypothetical protein AMATHDRAFT_46374 [Amanita thiersii Skay4041]
MFLKALLNILVLALAVAANPVVIRDSPIRLSLSRHLNVTSVHNLLRHDQARAKALKTQALAKIGQRQLHQDVVINEVVDNQAVVYAASVGVGSPATTYSLLIDTGSSNTWVGAGRAYVVTSTSVRTADSVSVTYGSGSFSGTEFIDTVSITSGLVIPQQSIGVASRSSGFDGFDGILGIGPVDLTLGTLSPDRNTLIPTVTDNAFSRGVITANEIGISFEPTNSLESLNGELTWGGIDSSKFAGSLTFAPLTSTSPSNLFWGIDQSVRYGSTSILSRTAGIVDTGTTLILLASDAISRYQSLTGAVFDGATGLLRLTTTQFANLQSLFFNVNGVDLEVTPNAQIWPRNLNSAIGGSSSFVYLIVGDIGTPSGEGFDFINGYTFLERYYSVFDTANRRVGFAPTSFTTATTN